MATLIAIGTSDLDVPPDMVIQFHKLASEAHRIKCETARGISVLENTVQSVGHKDVEAAHPPLPSLLLVADADHYNILNAASDAWLELFITIEKHLIE